VVRQNPEAELAGIKRKRPILVANRHADELDAFDHARQNASFRRDN
jgi:hypothetical protein